MLVIESTSISSYFYPEILKCCIFVQFQKFDECSHFKEQKYFYLPTNILQVPKDAEELAALQVRLRSRFPVDAYNKARKELDPNRILSNVKLEKLFPLSEAI